MGSNYHWYFFKVCHLMVSWGPLHTFFQHQKVLEKQLPSKSFLTVLLVWTKSLSVTKWSFYRGSQSFCCHAKMLGSHSNFWLFGAIFRKCTSVRFSLHGVSQGYLSQNGLCHDEHEHRKKETKSVFLWAIFLLPWNLAVNWVVYILMWFQECARHVECAQTWVRIAGYFTSAV